MTDEEIKAKYGKVTEIVTGDNGEYKAYLRIPNRYVLGAFMSKVNINMVVACEEFYQACVIKEISSPEILEDDNLFMGIIGELSSLIDLKKSHSRKL